MFITLITAGVIAAPAGESVPVSGGNPYRVIVDRNVFGLRDEPEPPPPAVEEPEPPANVKITGITKVLGEIQVLLLVQESGTPGPRSKAAAGEEVSYMLKPGQSKGPIKIVEIIDEDLGKVRIENAGVSSVISFETNGVKPAAPAAANKATKTPARPQLIRPTATVPRPPTPLIPGRPVRGGR